MRALYGLAALAVASGLSAMATPAAAIGADGREANCTAGTQSNTTTVCSVNNGISSASASVQVSPFIFMTATATAGGGMFGNAEAFLGYDFNILGGNVGDIVDIAVTAKMTTALTGDGGASDQLFYGNDDFSQSITVCDSINPAATACVDNHVYDGAFHFNGTVGDLQHLQIDIAATGGASGTGTATADPFIQITGLTDPTAHYTVETLGGVANALPGAGGVPEPATWAMLLAGFAGVGALARRRRPVIA